MAPISYTFIALLPAELCEIDHIEQHDHCLPRLPYVS
jgi:hypothetical protein